MTRNTTTGGRFQNNLLLKMIISGKHEIIEREKTLDVLQRNGRRHRIDILVDRQHLISCKSQNAKGTNEEKLPFEVMKLQDAIEDGKYERATIVLDGNGWSLKDYYLNSKDFKNKMKLIGPNVEIVCSKNFMKGYE
jgi:hypothetical protein